MDDSPIYTSTQSRWVRSFCIRGDSHVGRLQEPSTPCLSPIVIGSKSSPVYNAHTYHTKVPPEVIEQFILQFTKPSDTVLDPFCGSGMTGVAALKHGRRAVLIDISPFATFLAYNHCVPVDPITFKEALERILSEVREKIAWLYETICRKCQSHVQIEKMLWCEVVLCPACGTEIRLWDVAINSDIRVAKAFACPHCGARSQRGKAKRIGWKPVQMDVSCLHCGRDTVEPGAFDEQKLHAIESTPIPSTLWYPTSPVKWGDMWRRGYHEGIQTVADFYTKRNLWALAYLYEAIQKEQDAKLRSKLLFVFTNVVWLGSRMRRFNAWGGARPMNAALYIPAVMEEANILSVFAHKGKMILRMLWEIRNHDEHLLRVSTQTATNLSNIPDSSIDYMFTDPPYGGNIRYSEVNFIWEAWLQRFTNQRDEIVVSECQRKDVRRYGRLLEEAFKEAYRVLRPEAWMTITFNTSDKEVWETFQEALWGAGFDVRFVQILHKGHKSFKQLTSTHIAGYDVIVTCQRRGSRQKLSVSTPVSSKEARSLVAKIARQEARKGVRDLQLIYANVIAKLLTERRKGLLSFKEFLGLLDGKTKRVIKAPLAGKKPAQQQIALFSEDGEDH